MAKKVKFGLSTAPRAKPKKRPGRHKKSPNKHEKRMGKYRRKQLTLSNKVLYLRYERNKQKEGENAEKEKRSRKVISKTSSRAKSMFILCC